MLAAITIAITVVRLMVLAVPLIRELVKAAEVLFDTPKSGREKLAYVLDEIRVIYSLGGDIQWDVAAPFLNRSVSALAARMFPPEVKS